MANVISLENLTHQQSGRYLQWSPQETGSSSTNGAPTEGSSGVDVSDVQVAKVGVEANGGATLSFRMWLEYDNLSEFNVIDQGSRSGIDYNWTQEVDVSGAARLYVEITSIDTGTFDVHIGQAISPTSNGPQRIETYMTVSELPDSPSSGDRAIYHPVHGDPLLIEHRPSRDKTWTVISTGDGEASLPIGDGSGSLADLWNLSDPDSLPYTVNQQSVDVDHNTASTEQIWAIDTKLSLAPHLSVQMDINYNGASSPSSGTVTSIIGVVHSPARISRTTGLATGSLVQSGGASTEFFLYDNNGLSNSIDLGSASTSNIQTAQVRVSSRLAQDGITGQGRVLEGNTEIGSEDPPVSVASSESPSETIELFTKTSSGVDTTPLITLQNLRLNI
jgi:hypothetical protein